ncbi:hypothetical protein EI555_005272, partial [Monodon monoceros]
LQVGVTNESPAEAEKSVSSSLSLLPLQLLTRNLLFSIEGELFLISLDRKGKGEAVAYPLYMEYENTETCSRTLETSGSDRFLYLCFPGLRASLMNQECCVPVLCWKGKKKVTKYQKSQDPEADFIPPVFVFKCIEQLALTGRFWITPDILEPTVICITSAHECPIKAPKAFIKHSPCSISSALCLRRCQAFTQKAHYEHFAVCCYRPSILKSSEKAVPPCSQRTPRPRGTVPYLRDRGGDLVEIKLLTKEEQEVTMIRKKSPPQFSPSNPCSLLVTMKKDCQQWKVKKRLSPQNPTFTVGSYQEKCTKFIQEEECKYIREVANH